MKITVKYFAQLKDCTNCASEHLSIEDQTIKELFDSLNKKYQFPIQKKHIRFALNNEYVTGDKKLSDGDTVVFISPIAGG